jgi:aquaporin Z
MQDSRLNYPEYCMEALGLGLFMISASVITVILEHPASWVHQAIATDVGRRLMIGLGMGLTAIGLIYSPWGQQSGAHFNPVVTLTFFRLGKVKLKDACGYIMAQFVGGLLGITIAAKVLGGAIAHENVAYVVTVPGRDGAGVAFWAELLISFGMMMMVLIVSNHPKLARMTGIFAGILIATYITLEAPFSGMSMNPARTLASAISAQNWTAIWVYFTAPFCGMLAAAELYTRIAGKRAVHCAKFHHQNHKRCIFRCGYREMARHGSDRRSDRLYQIQK